MAKSKAKAKDEAKEERREAEEAATAGGDRLVDELDDRGEVREGQVYESLRSDEDDVGGGRRRVKVLSPDDGGKVLVENLSSRRLSHISADRLTPEHGWDRYV